MSLCTTVLSALVVSNAYVEKKQFYPTVVYLLGSNRSLGVIYLQAFMMLWFLCKFLKAVFFGSLRAAEVEVREKNRNGDNCFCLFALFPLFRLVWR